MAKDEEKVLDSFKANGGTEVRVRLSEYKGKKFLDIRKFYEDDAGEMQPTSKGITLGDTAQLDHLMGILKDNLDEIREFLPE